LFNKQIVNLQSIKPLNEWLFYWAMSCVRLSFNFLLAIARSMTLKMACCSSFARASIIFIFSIIGRFSSSSRLLERKNSDTDTSNTLASFSRVETAGSTLPFSMRLYWPCGIFCFLTSVRNLKVCKPMSHLQALCGGWTRRNTRKIITPLNIAAHCFTAYLKPCL
jgi:hypothetical protein